MHTSKNLTQASWLTVGVKLLVGVPPASNCFIGALILVKHRTTEAAEQRTAEVLAIRERVDVNLLETIVKLQKEFVALPQLFAVDAQKTIIERVEQEFQVQDRQQLAGRESDGSLFSRTEKRDLANGQTVVKIEDNVLTLAQGIFHAQGEFCLGSRSAALGRQPARSRPGTTAGADQSGPV